MEKIVRIFKSFEEADKAEIEYWRSASYEERINTLLSIQELMLQVFFPKAKRMEKVIRFRKLGEEE